MSLETFLPVAFVGLMGLSILVYVILDGYDLGVGILSGFTSSGRDRMVSSIAPFWDGNETWLVLGAGLLLVAFPMAHGIILQALYVPVFLMLIGLILRGVAFEFRIKAEASYKALWDRAFFSGSLLTALSQGFMLGFYIVGFELGVVQIAFSLLTAICLAGAYAFIGATWLIYRTEGDLQKQSVRWAKTTLGLAVLGLGAVSIASPLVSERIFDKWFSVPNVFFLMPIPVIAGVLLIVLYRMLKNMPYPDDRRASIPFLMSMAVFSLAFIGIAYSFFPYIIPEQMTIWEAAASSEALFIMLIGSAVVLPIIAGYSAYAYYIFRGKARDYGYG